MDRERQGGEWSIGMLFAQATATVIAHPAATLVPAFLVGTLPGSLLGYGIERIGSGTAEELGDGGVISVMLVWLAFGMVVDVLLQGAAAPVATAQAEGRQPALGMVLRSTASRLPALLALGLLVAERLGPVAALRRSWRLTRGAWPKVAGFRLVITGLYLGWVIVEGMGAIVVTHGVEALISETNEPLPIGYWLVSAVPQTLVLAWWAAAHGRLYASLRAAADGPPPARLAAIFA